MKKLVLGLLILVASSASFAHTGYCNNYEYRTGNCPVVATDWKTANAICQFNEIVIMVRADVGGGRVVPIGYACKTLL